MLMFTLRVNGRAKNRLWVCLFPALLLYQYNSVWWCTGSAVSKLEMGPVNCLKTLLGEYSESFYRVNFSIFWTS